MELKDYRAEYLNAVEGKEPSGKTVAFFYVSSTGRILGVPPPIKTVSTE